MALIKQLGNFDVTPLIDTYNSIEDKIVWTEAPHGKQASVQYKEGDDLWTSSVGKLKSNEPIYNLINPFFKNTVFEDLIKEYKMHRSRLMWVNPFSCYSFHNDHSPRIHFPLITNPECFFVFKTGSMTHFPAGEIWQVDTRFKHTFLNTSKIPRLHFVGVIEN